MLKQHLQDKMKQKQHKKKNVREVSESESDLSGFIEKDDYDPLDPNTEYFRQKKYVYKSSSDDLSEAKYSEIEQEELISAIIGEREDAEQLRILKMQKARKKLKNRQWFNLKHRSRLFHAASKSALLSRWYSLKPFFLGRTPFDFGLASTMCWSFCHPSRSLRRISSLSNLDMLFSRGLFN